MSTKGAKADEPRGDGGGAREASSRAPLSEWIVAGLSTLLVLAALCFMLREALTRPDIPAVISIRTDSIIAVPAGHLVMFTLRNDGGETAARVNVQGTLSLEGETVEESEATIDYLPVEARRSASLMFRADPAVHRLELRVMGFDAP
jgi:uncharacterized protein (TIGR02588 family)